MYDATWLFRGAQSALFYYVSCAPCTKVSTKRRRQRQIERDRRDREAYEAHDPDHYRQPSPYRTNAYWDEEISLGPGPPPKRAPKKKPASNASKSRSAKTDASGSPALSAVNSTMKSRPGDLSPLDSVKQKIQQAGELWNSRRYQREDEELWGLSKQTSASESLRPGTGGSSTGFPELANSRTALSSVESFYTAKAPPLNDLHPPVVSNPSSNRQNNRWMLQPPPSAKVMGGYEKANRGRSDSGNSGSSSRLGVASDVSLSRQVSEKILKKKLGADRSMQSLVSARSGGRYADEDGSHSLGQNHDRQHAFGSPRTRPADLNSPHLRAMPSYETSLLSRNTSLRRSISSRQGGHTAGEIEGIDDIDWSAAAVDQQPSKVVSPSLSVAANTNATSTTPSLQSLRPPQPAVLAPPTLPRSLSTHSARSRPPILTKDSSLHILQDLAPPDLLLSSYRVSSHSSLARAAADAVHIRLPSSDSADSAELADTGPRNVEDISFHDQHIMWSNQWESRDPKMRWSVS